MSGDMSDVSTDAFPEVIGKVISDSSTDDPRSQLEEITKQGTGSELKHAVDEVVEESLVELSMTDSRRGFMPIRELVLAIILLREGASGKRIREQMQEWFNYSPAPGTLYPLLHELRDEDVIEIADNPSEPPGHKEYVIQSGARDVVREEIREHVVQRMVLARVFQQGVSLFADSDGAGDRDSEVKGGDG